jgi:hypothetical protein
MVDGKSHHHEGYPKCRDDYEKSFKCYEGYFRDAVCWHLKKFPDVNVINHSPTSSLKEFLGYEPL